MSGEVFVLCTIPLLGVSGGALSPLPCENPNGAPAPNPNVD